MGIKDGDVKSRENQVDLAHVNGKIFPLSPNPLKSLDESIRFAIFMTSLPQTFLSLCGVAHVRSWGPAFG